MRDSVRTLSRKKILAELVSHDGLHDSLTGLLALPAFIESATRIISSTMRSNGSLNIFLVSLLNTNEPHFRQLAVTSQRALSDMQESEINELAARMVMGAGILKREIREADLACRYTFTDFILINMGDYEVIAKKIQSIGEQITSSVVGTTIESASENGGNLSAQNALLSAIATVEALQVAQSSQ